MAKMIPLHKNMKAKTKKYNTKKDPIKAAKGMLKGKTSLLKALLKDRMKETN
ncbi:MAG: hypothetical protein AAB017_02635 [Nitrospirota bacterium]